MHAGAMNVSPSYPRSLLACLGDASRFQLVRSLIEAERCVTELARDVGLSQSCTTRHLQALAREGLVRGEREGKRVVFRLRREEPSVSALLEWALRGADASDVNPFAAAVAKASAESEAARRKPSRAARPRPATLRGRMGAGKTQAPPLEDRADPSTDFPPQADEPRNEPQTIFVRRPDLEDYLL